MKLSIAEIQDKIIMHGRCALYHDMLNVDWVGAGLSLRFFGDSIRVFFETDAYKLNPADKDPIYVYSEIDGIAQKFAIMDSKEVLVIDGLENKEHTFKIMRITELFFPEQYLFISGIDFGRKGIDALLKTPPAPGMRFDFYGDSITNAYASLTDPITNEKMQCNNDYSISYANQTALNFYADACVCAVSGHGIVSVWDGNRSEPMKNYYKQKSRHLPIEMDFSKKPDLIVIALGTNDFAAGVSDDEMRKGMLAFIQMIRQDMPDTDIIWIYGMMTNGYCDMMQSLFEDIKKSDNHFYSLHINIVEPEQEEVGGDGHPNRKGQKRIADELTAFIRSELNL